MTRVAVLKSVALVLALGSAGAGAYLTRATWLPLVLPPEPAPADEHDDHDHGAPPPGKIVVSEQAQTNLGISAKKLVPQTYWRTIEVPGMVVDRPGHSDRGVLAPATAAVTKVFRVPGDTVRPGEPLFALKLLSESLHQTQTDLFKTVQDTDLARAQKKLLESSAGAVPEARVIEVDNQISRLEVAAKAYRGALAARGFTPEQIASAGKGTFVTEMTVVAPPAHEGHSHGEAYEMQELKADLGGQVQAGQVLCTLANHHLLAIEGRAFRDETPLLERSVSEKWPVEVDFREEPTAGWGAVKQTFRIRQLANVIDPQTRTFGFFVPLENESRAVTDEGRSQTLWRFRPGQQVRLHVRVEELKDVFVLPADAVTTEGAEAFAFTQNVNTFTRRPVRVLLRDRQQVVLANDGSLTAGSYAVQSAAAQLNRMAKAGSSGGVPKGYHMHADGSLHKNGDPEK
jgi:membrane fusion protein, heavy metal efflux system